MVERSTVSRPAPTVKRWISAFRRRRVDALARTFSLNAIGVQDPGLAAIFRWGTNAMPAASGPLWLHLGCGERVFDGFVNLDFIPYDARVMEWNLLDLWPADLAGIVKGVFSEDTLEHFFHAEQAYILCNVNRALEPGAVARTLMPSLARLVQYSADWKPRPDELLHTSFGVETGGDALNMGMRFSGHRWLHDHESLARMAAWCGFETIPTSCATSTVEKFNGLNLRDESNSLAFANDLRKRKAIERVLVLPRDVTGAEFVEDTGGDVQLFVATSERPRVEYTLPGALDPRSVACINIRSANLSSFFEHNLKTLVVDDVHSDRPWHFDETLKSRSCMNLVSHDQMRLVAADAPTFSKLSFSPAARVGERFTLGCAEVFVLHS